jgi:hypothetical protein
MNSIRNIHSENDRKVFESGEIFVVALFKILHKEIMTVK